MSMEFVELGGFMLLYSNKDLLVFGLVYIFIFSSNSGFIAKLEFVFSEESIFEKLCVLGWLLEDDDWSSK